eukprot:357161-Chlamydomonas_euryale.AAC.2
MPHTPHHVCTQEAAQLEARVSAIIANNRAKLMGSTGASPRGLGAGLGPGAGTFAGGAGAAPPHAPPAARSAVRAQMPATITVKATLNVRPRCGVWVWEAWECGVRVLGTHTEPAAAGLCAGWPQPSPRVAQPHVFSRAHVVTCLGACVHTCVAGAQGETRVTSVPLQTLTYAELLNAVTAKFPGAGRCGGLIGPCKCGRTASIVALVELACDFVWAGRTTLLFSY